MKIKPAQSAAANARVVLPKMARKYFEAGRDAIEGKQPPEELHGFRLETKRFRYTLELFRPLYGPNLDRYLKALRELQGALGKVSDYQAIQRVLSKDPVLNKQIEHALKGKVKSLRQSWRAFDSDGQLKRWRSYLAGEHSKPKAKVSARVAAKKTRKTAPAGSKQAR
jgi:CHAD domain-containing protein